MTGEHFRVLITCGAFEPGSRGGGPVRSVANIADTVSDGIDALLITSDRDLGTADPYPGLSGRWVVRKRTRVFYLNVRAVRQWLRLWRDLRNSSFDLLYVNSFWSPLFTVLPVVAMRLRLFRCRRLLIAPRGEFSPGALSLKATKKRIWLRLVGRFLSGAAVRWHASTAREAAEIRSVWPAADITIILNQVALPEEPLEPMAGAPTVRLTFIGRITPMKNLGLAIEALHHVAAPVELDIYGPVEDRAYWSRCQSSVDRLPDRIRVRYHGELAGDLVRSTFSRYDAFVFPTLGENFGHIIAESLSASCPVICSDATPWTAVLAEGGGRVMWGGGAEEITAEIERIAAMTPTERLRARELAGSVYRSWRAGVANQNILDQERVAHLTGPAA